MLGVQNPSRVNTPTPPATAMRIQSSVLGAAKALGWGQNRITGNLIWYGDFQSIAQKSQGGGGKGLGAGGGGKGSSGSTTYNYQAAVAIGLCDGPITSVIGAFNNQSPTTLAALNLTTFVGNYTQAPWGYLASKHPTQALAYRGTAYLAAGPMQLGSSQELPNISFEVKFAIADAISGLPDANPKDVLYDFLTNVNYGVGFPTARVGDLSVYSDYCLANGLVVSPVLQSQSAGNSFVSDLMKATNSEIVWAGGKLTVVPYGDQTVTGNGHTYNPPSSAIYSVNDSDMLPNANSSSGGSDPVDITRSAQRDTLNIIRVEYLDRDNDYNPDVAEALDEAAIADFGPRPSDKIQMHLFCNAAAAQLSAQLQLGRQNFRNTATITLGPEYILLDPMDIIEYIDVNLGAQNQWVRIKEIQENSDGSLSFTVEEYLLGGGSAPTYGTQASTSYAANYNSDPGNADIPAVFDVPVQLSDVIGLETWLATSGGLNWGGCEVWISTDNATYALEGRLLGQSRMGGLAADFASSSDPDTTVTCSVDLTRSRTDLVSGSTADADAGRTLCFVDGEYISYSTASLTSAFHYDLTTYIRRGQYGSVIGFHPVGSLFVRLDDSVFTRPYAKTDVGTLIYIKLRSFNIWGGGIQDLSTLTPYTHTVGGPPTEYAPASLSAISVPQGVQLNWVNPPDIGVEAVEVWRSDTASFGGATHIDDAAAYSTSYTDQNTLPLTPYWYWIRLRDIAGGVTAYEPSSGGPGATETTGAVASGFPGNGDPSFIANSIFVDNKGNPLATGWRQPNPTSATLIGITDRGASFNPPWNFRYQGQQTTRDAYYGDFFPVAPGQNYFLSLLDGDNTTPFDTGLGLYFVDANFTTISWLHAFSVTSGASFNSQTAGQVTVPAGAVYAMVWSQIDNTGAITGTWEFSGAICRKAPDSNMLVDNSVATDHVQDNAITNNPNTTSPSTVLSHDGSFSTLLASVTFNQDFDRAPVHISASGIGTQAGATLASSITLQLYIDGVYFPIPHTATYDGTLSAGLESTALVGGGTPVTLFTIFVVLGALAAGSHTVDLYGIGFNATGNSGYPYYNPIYSAPGPAAVATVQLTHPVK